MNHGRSDGVPPQRVAAGGLAAAACAALVLLLLAPAAGQPIDEAAVLRRLRSVLWNAAPGWNFRLRVGWHPDDESHPCQWSSVECDAQKHITAVVVEVDWAGQAPPLASGSGSSDASGGGGSGINIRGGGDPLLPELARLPELRRLVLNWEGAPPWAGIPQEWLARAAFPRLAILSLSGTSLAARLPDIPTGALPSLQALGLHFPGMTAALPASWGAAAAALPQLGQLKITLAGLRGSLPGEWSHGFRQLTELAVAGLGPPGARPGSACPGPRQASPAGSLPEEWAAQGAFPKLDSISLQGLGVSGTLPPAWVASGFAALRFLSLERNRLSGTLPPQLLLRGSLVELRLSGNCLSGTLPEAWAGSRVHGLELANNSLSGPAFPPAWLGAGALQHLITLDVSGNAGLTGTLPRNLSWPALTQLRLAATGVHGGVPDAYCRAPFAAQLIALSLPARPGGAPALPPCAAHSFPRLEQAVPGPGQVPGPHGTRRPLGVAAGLAALLPLAALAVAARKRRLQRAQRSGEGPRERGPSACSLDALLSSQLGPGNSLRLLHTAGWPTVQHASQLLPLGSAAEGTPLLTGSSAGSPNAQAAGTAGWSSGLSTDSLHLMPGELKFETDERGAFLPLGRGAQGIVLRARLHGCFPVAVKVTHQGRCSSPPAAWREVALLRRCMHPRIVPLVGVATLGELLLLVFKLMEGGSLERAMRDDATRELLHWSAGGRQVALDVAEGLAFLHGQLHIMHGDLKPSNVLLGPQLRACLGDLGVAQALGSRPRTAAGFTAAYAAPEQLLGQRCTAAADIYSFGVLLTALVTQQRATRRGAWRLPEAPQECSQSMLALIEECISPDPVCRPTAAKVLQRLRDGC